MIRHSLFALPFVLAAPALAQSQIISAPEAFAAVDKGEMILIDIRSPEEWQQTGVAQGAVALTMHSRDFPKKISQLLDRQRGKTIALICATGGRTNYVVSFLAKNGFSDVRDVSEGMMGNKRGSGWIARGMPLSSSKEAQDAYEDLAKAAR